MHRLRSKRLKNLIIDARKKGVNIRKFRNNKFIDSGKNEFTLTELFEKVYDNDGMQ